MSDETWEVLAEEEVVSVPPFLRVRMQTVRLPEGEVIGGWPIVEARSYANAFVLNEAGEALVLEGYKHGIGRSSWQLVGGYLEPGEEPLAAIQRETLEETGCASDDWQALGSFVVDANRRVGVAHFFLARHARQIATPDHGDLEGFHIKWAPLAEVERALADGRIVGLGYAANVALALLALLALQSSD